MNVTFDTTGALRTSCSIAWDFSVLRCFGFPRRTFSLKVPSVTVTTVSSSFGRKGVFAGVGGQSDRRIQEFPSCPQRSAETSDLASCITLLLALHSCLSKLLWPRNSVARHILKTMAQKHTRVADKSRPQLHLAGRLSAALDSIIFVF